MMICSQCGGNEMISKNGQLYCTYCRTMYISIKEPPPTKNSGKNIFKILLIYCGIFSILVLVIITLLSIGNSVSSLSEKAEQPDVLGHKNIALVKGWSEEIFDNIQVAKPHYGEDKKYTEGTKFSDLVQQVGNPQLIQVWSHADYVEMDTTFSTEDYSKYKVDIQITYDKQSGYITKKSVSGYEQKNASFSKKDYEFIPKLGWKKKQYDEIQVATRILNRSNNVTTYENGELISELLNKVPEPTQIRHETGIDGGATTVYSWKKDFSPSITIRQDDGTNWIIEKSISQ